MNARKVVYGAGLLVALATEARDSKSGQPAAAVAGEVTEVSTDTVRCCDEAERMLGAKLGHPSRPTTPIKVTSGDKQLFMDNYSIARLDNVRRMVNQPKKEGAVLKPDRPWEGDCNQIRTAPLWNSIKKVWEMWYYASVWQPAYATSRDGVHWEKPALGLKEFQGSKENNLLPVHVNYIIRDDAEQDPGRRYKGFVIERMNKRFGGFLPAVSADGLTWTVSKAPVIQSWDEGHLFYDDSKRIFVAMVKHNNPYGRAVCLSLSKDFQRWTDPKDCLVFHADKRDQDLGAQRIRLHVQSADLLKPVLDRPEEYETDIYSFPVFAYEGLYIALPTVFNHSGDVDGNSDGFNMVELAVSRDLLNWERVGERQKFIPLSELEGGKHYDTGQILAARQPIKRDGELWFYYSGIRYRGREFYKTVGGRAVEPDNGAICLAKLRLDGFVSLDAGERDGYILTKPLLLEGRSLHLNLSAPQGEVRAEILDANGDTPIPGFAMQQAAKVRGNHLDVQLEWEGGRDISALRSKPVRIRFSLRNASLYAFWVNG